MCVKRFVGCGQHNAASCEGCPQGNGEAWCNGECQWNQGGGFGTGTCIPRQVNCGLHDAGSCAECPKGNGGGWCNGECSWIGGSFCVKVG